LSKIFGLLCGRCSMLPGMIMCQAHSGISVK